MKLQKVLYAMTKNLAHEEIFPNIYSPKVHLANGP